MMDDNMRMFLSFICMLAVYLIAYNLMKKNKAEETDLKRVKWMAFGISLVVVGIGRIVLLPD